MIRRYGALGSGMAWPLARGQAETESLTYGLEFSIGDLEDPDEYSDGDEEPEEVGGDWWETEAVPSMWRLVERHLTDFGFGDNPRQLRRLWPDPVVTAVGMSNLDPLERLYVA